MPVQLEYLLVSRDLTHHLVLDLRVHETELLSDLMGMQVWANLGERASGFFDLPFLYQLARRVGHEGGQADEQDDTPGDLDSQRQTPLQSTIWGVAAGKPNPVGCHGSQRQSHAGQTTNETSDLRGTYFG